MGLDEAQKALICQQCTQGFPYEQQNMQRPRENPTNPVIFIGITS
jgi:hypothetical protein